MKNVKKLSENQLEKFSTVFTQLGLVLVLFVVFVVLERQTEQKKITIASNYEPNETYSFIEAPKIYVKKVVMPKPLVPRPFEQSPFIDEVQKVDNTENFIETVIDKPTGEVFDINSVKTVTETSVIDPNDDPIRSFVSLEEAPIFKGCEGLSKEENKKCFEEKIRQFVQNNFRAELAEDLGLQSGIHRISTQFVIDKIGNVVDIKIRAPHKSLEKETNRLINALPQFIPGKQNGNNVKVSYSLPILFRVE